MQEVEVTREISFLYQLNLFQNVKQGWVSWIAFDVDTELVSRN